MKKRLIITALGLLLGTLPALAVGGVGLDPAQTVFHARQLGMGGAALGFADDASGVFANPAALTGLEFPQLTAASRKLVFDETQYTLLCWALPTGWGTFGLGYTALNTGGSPATQRDPATTRIILDPSREAGSQDNHVLAFSYARKLQANLSVGGTLKMFSQSLSGSLASQANGYGLDLAASYQVLPWLTTAADLQDLLEGNLAWAGGATDKVGGFYKFGARLDLWGPTNEALYPNQQKLAAGIDLDLPHSSLAANAYHLGLDYSPLKNVFLRTGLNLESAGSGLTFGVGLVNGGFRFDYAFVQRPGLPGDTPHYFSLSYIGERVATIFPKLKRKESAIVWLNPKDRSVTEAGELTLKAHVQEKRIVDQKTVWTVTGLSETSEVREVVQYADLPTVYLNGIKLEKSGTIESTTPLAMGRNVFELVGYGTDNFASSSEVRVLRFKPFSDTPMSHWAIEPIALSVTLGLVKGYPNDTFKPEKGITRAELITLLVRTLPVRLADEVAYAGFDDVPKKHWAAQYIAYGSYKGLVTGYPGGKFLPNKVLTRAEGVTILARYSNLAEKKETGAAFPDLKTDFWANKYIGPAKEAGLLNYLSGKKFEPSAHFTRAEACEVLYRTPPIKQGVDQYWETGIIGAVQPKVPATQAP